MEHKVRTHKMIDFETFGKKPDTAVLSLGLVLFTREALLTQKYWVFNTEDQLAAGRTVDPDTMAWWEKQGDAAYAVHAQAREGGVTLKQFGEEYHELTKSISKGTLAWARGLDFDFPILEHILASQNVPVPYSYWNKRDYRTLRFMFKIEEGIPKPEIKHHALEDALFQARGVAKFLAGHPECDK
jgi:hypothetical protein